MLTDLSRGPFTIETKFHEAVDPPWGANAHWSWRLIEADGKCFEEGSGYSSETEARTMALAVSKNEMA